MGAADPRLSETVDKNVFDFSPIHLTKESDSIPRTTCLVGLVKVTAPGGMLVVCQGASAAHGRNVEQRSVSVEPCRGRVLHSGLTGRAF